MTTSLMAAEDWDLADAPRYQLPDDRRVRLARHVPAVRLYRRVNGVVVVMAPDHYIVWSAWGQNGSRPVGRGLPAYVPRKTWDLTYANLRRAGHGLLFADKINDIRAAVYKGPPTRILVNENDPTNPDTWASIHPGDHVALAIDRSGNPMTYVASDGVVRQDHYPIHGDIWRHLGWEPVTPLPHRTDPTISNPQGPVQMRRVRTHLLVEI